MHAWAGIDRGPCQELGIGRTRRGHDSRGKLECGRQINFYPTSGFCAQPFRKEVFSMFRNRFKQRGDITSRGDINPDISLYQRPVARFDGDTVSGLRDK